MLSYFIQRAPSTFRTATSSFLLHPKYSARMSSAVPRQVTANTRQIDVSYRTLALHPSEDSRGIHQKYRPFILSDDATEDWEGDISWGGEQARGSYARAMFLEQEVYCAVNGERLISSLYCWGRSRRCKSPRERSPTLSLRGICGHIW